MPGSDTTLTLIPAFWAHVASFRSSQIDEMDRRFPAVVPDHGPVSWGKNVQHKPDLSSLIT